MIRNWRGSSGVRLYVVPDSVSRIQQLLTLTARRSAWLSAGRAGALALAALFVGLAVATLAVGEGSRRLGAVVLVAATSAALALVFLRVRGMRQRLSSRGQADAIEAVTPDLRGALTTVIDRVERPMGSPGLFFRLADEVAGGVGKVRPALVWPLRPLWQDVRWSAFGAALLVGVTAVGPLNPIDAMRKLLGGSPAAAAVTPVEADGPKALLGDITLRYVYPPYTQLDPLEVPNTNGEVHAPPGTVVEVRAKTAEAWTAAVLEVSGEDPVPAGLVDGRVVIGSFTVGAEGTWRFRFDGTPSADFRIVPDPDLAPTVAVSSRAKQSIGTDQPFSVGFAVKDDYGLTRIVAEVTVRGKVTEVLLRTPLDMPRALSDQRTLRAADLGLTAGDVAKVRIGAWDNDEVSGNKVGWSAIFTIEVLGAEGSQAQNRELRDALLEALILPLAESLLDPALPADTGAGATTWAGRADDRYGAFDEVARGAEGLNRRNFQARVIENVNGARRDLFAFVRGLPVGTLGNIDATTFAALQAKNVRTLEMAVWTLDKVARAEAYATIVKLAEELAADARAMKESLESLTTPQALARLDRIDRQMDVLDTLARKLDRGGMRSFLESRIAELEGAMAAARRDVAKGADAAKQAADIQRIADLLDEMAGGVDEAQKRGGEGDDALQKEIERLDKEFSELAAALAALEKKTQAAREKHGQSLDDGLKAWAEVEAAAKAAERALADPSLGALPSRSVQGGVGDAQHDAKGLNDSVRARDTEQAADRAEDTVQSIERARRRLDGAARTGQVEPSAAAAAGRSLEAAQKAAVRAATALEKLEAAQSTGSPELTEALKALSGEQAGVAGRAGEAAKAAKKVAQQMQSDASEMEEAAGEGASQAKRATGELEKGDAMASEGAQDAASDAFLRASEALKQAVADQKKMQQEAGGGGEQGEPEEGAGGGEGVAGEGNIEVTIPAPEEFETPEAYRKALLEGMQGEVPESYRAASRRYYEELVRQ